MRVALMLPSQMTAEAHALADDIRGTGVGLRDIIALAPAMTSRAGLRARLQLVKGLLTGVRQPRGTTATAYAHQHGLVCWRSPKANDPATREALCLSGADVVVSYAAGILRPALLDLPGVLFLNGHAGRLPEFGGMNVVEWAVLNDQPIWGTVHRIDNGIDTGDILLERPLALARPGTVRELRAIAFRLAWALVPEALDGLARGTLRFRSQSRERPRMQWFRMHPRLVERVEQKLRDGSFFRIQEQLVLVGDRPSLTA